MAAALKHASDRCFTTSFTTSYATSYADAERVREVATALKHASVTDAQEDFFRQLNAQPSGAQRFTFFF